MARLIILIALLAAVYYGYQRISALPPARRKTLWWVLGLGALVIISWLAVASGRMHPVGGILAVLAAAARFGAIGLFRLWPLVRATGKDAVFRTKHLEVRFLVKTSQLQGAVLKGRYAGDALHTMPIECLQQLAADYQDTDRKSYYLVKVFLQRAGAARTEHQQQEYQQQERHQQEHNQQQAAFSSSPSRDEALMILGLNGSPSEKEITSAHRRLIQKLHPDRGGNDYLAARINQARDLLLKQL